MSEEWSSYISGWKRRVARDQQKLREWYHHARKEAERLAHFLVDHYGVKRVYLIGSLTHGHVHRGSDIDLAVEGLPPNLYWQASARLERETETPVDLIDLDSASASIIDRVRREGVLLVERGK